MSYAVDGKRNIGVSGNTLETGLGTEYRLLVVNGRLQIDIIGGACGYPYNPELDDDDIPTEETRETVIAILYAKDPTGNMERVLTDGLGKIQTTATVIAPGAYNPQDDDCGIETGESHESNICLLYGLREDSVAWQCLETDNNGRLQIADGGGSITVDGTFWQATQPISAAALPLPVGASTSAIQATMNTSLDEIESAIENLEESLQSIGTDYLLIGDAGAIINLDAAGHPQVDVITMPAVAVTGTFWQATQPISAAALPLPAGAATQATLATIDADTSLMVPDLDAIRVDAAAIEVLITAGNVDLAAMEVLLTNIQNAVQIMDDWDSGDRCKVEIDQVDAVYNPETDDGQIPDGEVHDTIISVLYAYNTTATDLKRVLVNNSGALMVYTP